MTFRPFLRPSLHLVRVGEIARLHLFLASYKFSLEIECLHRFPCVELFSPAGRLRVGGDLTYLPISWVVYIAPAGTLGEIERIYLLLESYTLPLPIRIHCLRRYAPENLGLFVVTFFARPATAPGYFVLFFTCILHSRRICRSIHSVHFRIFGI